MPVTAFERRTPMKSKEELNALKEEVEALNEKLAELTEEELTQVTGGKAVDNRTGGSRGKFANPVPQ